MHFAAAISKIETKDKYNIEIMRSDKAKSEIVLMSITLFQMKRDALSTISDVIMSNKVITRESANIL